MCDTNFVQTGLVEADMCYLRVGLGSLGMLISNTSIAVGNGVEDLAHEQ